MAEDRIVCIKPKASFVALFQQVADLEVQDDFFALRRTECRGTRPKADRASALLTPGTAGSHPIPKEPRHLAGAEAPTPRATGVRWSVARDGLGPTALGQSDGGLHVAYNYTSVQLAAEPFKGARGPCSSTNTESPTSARATLILCGGICEERMSAPGGRQQRGSDSSEELSVLAQRRIWLHAVRTEQDRVQEQAMDAGLGTLAKTSFDSLAKSIYTLSDERKDQLLYAQWP